MNTSKDENTPFSMVSEACDSYHAEIRPDGKLEIHIVAPKRFAALWLVKMTGLVGTIGELQEFGDLD